jgi:hypothetical protein
MDKGSVIGFDRAPAPRRNETMSRLLVLAPALVVVAALVRPADAG